MTIRELLAASGSGAKVIDKQTFTASGTWTKPAGVLDTDVVRVDLWGGGGSGGVCNNTTDLSVGNGGGGGAHNLFELLASELNSTEPVIVGSGGAAVSLSAPGSALEGNNGGYSEFKGRRAYGGTRGSGTPPANGGAGGLGGGIYGAGTLATSAHGGEPQILAPYTEQGSYSSNPALRWAPGEWGGGGNFLSQGLNVAQHGAVHGGGGCIVNSDRTLRSSVWGGGAGATFQSGSPVANGTELGGLSIHGGNGGDCGVPTSSNATVNGSNGQPRGGGGGGAKRGSSGTATSGAGGRGEVVITIIRR